MKTSASGRSAIVNLSKGDTRLIIDTCRKHGLLRNQCAYVLSTSWHETAHTMKPVREYGGEKYLRSKPYYPYVGMGYVQLTWKTNFERASRELGVDFVKYPKKLLEPRYAAEILVVGSKDGWFTGKKLSDYMTLTKSDFKGARRIINGTDKADLIARYAREFDDLLKADGYGEKDAPAPAPTKTESMSITEGDKGPLIEELQRNLVTLGYDTPVDGVFGPKTKKAVVEFQRQHRDDEGNQLKADGIVGLRTSKAISAALLKPKIEEAKKSVPQTADKEIKKRSTWWSWFTGLFGSGAVGFGWFRDLDWQAVAAIGGVAFVFLITLVLMRQQILATFDDIRARAKD